MPHIQHDHDHQNQQRIKDIQHELMTEQVPALALRVLDHAHNIPHHDESARGVLYVEMLVPVCEVGFRGAGGRAGVDCVVESYGYGDEEGEEDELEDEAADDDVRA